MLSLEQLNEFGYSKKLITKREKTQYSIENDNSSKSALHYIASSTIAKFGY